MVVLESASTATRALKLGDVFIEAECSKLTYEQLKQEKKGRPKPNPYLEGEVNGGRHKLLETVIAM